MSASVKALSPREIVLLSVMHSPMTVGEIAGQVRGVLELGHGLGGSVMLALRQIDGDAQEIRRLLTRLESKGLVGRLVLAPNESHLWWRL